MINKVEICGVNTTKLPILSNEEKKEFTLGGHTYKEGDYISLDGNTGKIYKGDVPTKEATVSGDFGRIMKWADEDRTL